MGKHRTQFEKLNALRQRLDNDDKIPNREIRAVLGQDFPLFEGMLKEVKEDQKSIERSDGQKKAEQYIKQTLMLEGRSIDNSMWAEKAGEALNELPLDELEAMRYWKRDPNSGVVEYDGLDGNEDRAIYRSFKISVTEAKQMALYFVIERLLNLKPDRALKQRLQRQRELWQNDLDI